VSDLTYEYWKDIVVALYYKANYSASQIAEFFSNPKLVRTLQSVARRYADENPECPYVIARGRKPPPKRRGRPRKNANQSLFTRKPSP
jgi:hypothetical protein